MIIGIDEVGRGCWAGPVVAGAVLLAGTVAGLNDSKLLSKKRREELASEIQIKAVCWALGWVPAETIDEVGINTAVKMAMEQAVSAIDVPYDEIVVDGNINFLADVPRSRSVIKADTLVPAVSAASIIAKVARDSYMADMASLYPGYGFERHVGYGTAMHIAALRQHGISVIHRKSYKPIRQLM